MFIPCRSFAEKGDGVKIVMCEEIWCFNGLEEALGFWQEEPFSIFMDNLILKDHDLEFRA